MQPAATPNRHMSNVHAPTAWVVTTAGPTLAATVPAAAAATTSMQQQQQRQPPNLPVRHSEQLQQAEQSEEDLAVAALKIAVQNIRNSQQVRTASRKAAEIAAEEGLPVTSSSSDLLDLLLQRHKINPASLTDHDRQRCIQRIDEGR
jgi:hypothetical protein